MKKVKWCAAVNTGRWTGECLVMKVMKDWSEEGGREMFGVMEEGNCLFVW